MYVRKSMKQPATLVPGRKIWCGKNWMVSSCLSDPVSRSALGVECCRCGMFSCGNPVMERAPRAKRPNSVRNWPAPVCCGAHRVSPRKVISASLTCRRFTCSARGKDRGDGPRRAASAVRFKMVLWCGLPACISEHAGFQPASPSMRASSLHLRGCRLEACTTI